jgi:hypothetical protein
MEGRVKGKRAPEMEETGADDRTLLLTDGSWQSIHPFLKLGSPVSKKKVLAAFSEIPVELTAVEVTRDAQAEWGEGVIIWRRDFRLALVHAATLCRG